MRTGSGVIAAVLALACLLAGSPPADAVPPRRYSVMLLRPLPDSGVRSAAHGINNRGEVVGGSFAADGTATLWRAASGLATSLGTTGWAEDIADNGAVVGTRTDRGAVSAYVTGRGHGATGAIGSAGAIAADGTVAGTSGAGDRAVIVAPGGNPTPIAPATSSGLAISDDGTQVSGLQNGSPTRWDDGSAVALDMPFSASAPTIADVNDIGVSVGCTSRGPAQWNADGRVKELPGTGCAWAVNDGGVIAGTRRGETGWRAVVWIAGEQLDLDTFVSPQDRVTLTTVNDINDEGQIVGTARLADGRELGYVATPTAPVTVYTAPGYHEYNGRRWNTGCHPYSRTVRCETMIWSTNVVHEDGKFVPRTGWAPNTVTYLPFMTRKDWGANPLANPGAWEQGGRSWQTVCGTPLTGANACRSYVWSQAVSTGADGSFTLAWRWIPNSVVFFA